MRYVFLSPDFPPNLHLFAWHLRNYGGEAIGISHVPYESLPPQVQQSLNSYYYVSDLHNTQEVQDIVAHIASAHGLIDGIESFNEHWLELEAVLRDQVGCPGFRPEDMPAVKQKLRMKDFFTQAGALAIPGIQAHRPQEVEDFIAEHGLPIIAKPNVGVGASRTYKLTTPGEVERFLQNFTSGYLIEKFIAGTIQTYDGLVDREGNIVFAASMEYSRGVAEVITGDGDIFFYVQREIPPDLALIGPQIVKAYQLRGRFFHFEFIRSYEGPVYAMEVNMRPPGYPCLDMFNFAHDMDIYQSWARMVYGYEVYAPKPPYYCFYVSRKNTIGYAFTHADVVEKVKPWLILHDQVNPLFRNVMGDEMYILRGPDKEVLLEKVLYIQRRLLL
ncbi:MAG: ATP-grasp domain-containing protein [Bacteroidia bacterium]